MLIEISTYRLAAGVSESAFLAVDARVQTEFVPFQPGFVRRTTARGEDGEWVVVVLWGSDAEADAARAASSTHPAAVSLETLVEPGSARTTRYMTLD